VARRLRLAADVVSWVLVKSRLAHLVAEIVRFASVFRLVLGRLLVHFHSANRIFRQISTSSRILSRSRSCCSSKYVNISLYGLVQGNDASTTSQTSSR